LGHVISKGRITIDPKKIEAIRGWPTPKNVTKVRSLMGLVGCYISFIEGFFKISHSIISLEKKTNKFKWTPKCEEILYFLKKLLTSAPILKIASPNEDCVVCIDALQRGTWWSSYSKWACDLL
jgi:hypothetical protein